MRTKYTQKCNNWPGGWIASNDIVSLCQYNAPENSKVSIVGTEVWAEWIKDNDPLCFKPTTLTTSTSSTSTPLTSTPLTTTPSTSTPLTTTSLTTTPINVIASTQTTQMILILILCLFCGFFVIIKSKG